MSLNYRNTEDSVSQARCACHILVTDKAILKNNVCLLYPYPAFLGWVGR